MGWGKAAQVVWATLTSLRYHATAGAQIGVGLVRGYRVCNFCW
jgi:hypothetical protein